MERKGTKGTEYGGNAVEGKSRFLRPVIRDFSSRVGRTWGRALLQAAVFTVCALAEAVSLPEGSRTELRCKPGGKPDLFELFQAVARMGRSQLPCLRAADA